MALTGVACATDLARGRAEALARELNLPLITSTPGDAGVRLIVELDRVSLGFGDPKRGKPFAVDFATAAWRARLARPLPRAHILRRALGDPRTIIDATAGFGGDAALMQGLGAEVTAIERSPVVAALLADGLARAPDVRVKLVRAEATEYLKTARAEVIYLDPMFTKPKSTAKSPKEMQLLQEILSPPDDEAALFAAAWGAATKRVVVKRALKGPPIRPAPSHTFRGQSVRYDVFVKA